MSSDGTADPAALLALAVAAAEAAAAFLLAGLHDERAVVDTKSTGTDMVTEMDRGSEALIVDHLLGQRPHDGVLGEEGADRAGTSGVTWVIDPLDGTTNYLYRHPGFSVSIAAVTGEVGDEAVVGVVVDPLRAETFTAIAGEGSRCNGERLTGPRPGPLAEALVGTGFGYDPAQRARQGQVVAVVLPQIRDIRRDGGAALDLCSVASGRLDAHYERGLAPWDLAAGALIAREAGARVGDFTGGPPGPAGAIAAHPGLFDQLVECLVAAGAADT